ncbi:SIR2 family protein [Streptomyces sp. UG1]|uniref:SIR2 family protein n=1 Tax=Streptomyces sp. UG1 TaxID=3417652 RepID=UPI003CEF40ED
MEPHVNLAFSVRATPGGYAVLLGAGSSIAAGMPSAWDVQQDLIRKVAAAEGVTETGDPHAWYKERFGRTATYDDLLARLANTPLERQALLRAYFEPSEEDREEGRMQPTAAHRAIARLVADGHVRIVLTTNFDRLMETALREMGVEPTVAADPADAAGLAPLHTIKCLVVHVHGDYLNPTSMLNTPEELKEYAPAVDTLLDRIFADYGLIISGWSAKWDPALRNALSRCPSRMFTSYWTDPRELSEHAQDLLTRRGAVYVQTDADAFFAQVADAVDAIADSRRHPASIAVAVASAKRALSGAGQAITLHDSLRREVSRIIALPLRSGPWQSSDANEHSRRLSMLEAETELLLALVATTAYWGTSENDRWWIHDIEQLGSVSGGGDLALIRLAQAPATMMIYAAGIAALVAERWPTLVRVLSEPQAQHLTRSKMLPAAALLGPQTTIGKDFDGAERLHAQLRPVFTEHLILGDTAYLEAWERFAYLRLIVQQDAGMNIEWPHIRSDRYDGHQLAPAVWLTHEPDRHGDLHPLLEEGLFDGDVERLRTAKEAVQAEYISWARMMPR